MARRLLSHSHSGSRTQRGRMESIASGLPRALAPVLAHRGGARLAALVAAWEGIVGPDLAARIQPVRLVRRSDLLILEVEAGFALEIQHREPELIGRINDHMGYACVARLRLVQVGARARPANRARDGG